MKCPTCGTEMLRGPLHWECPKEGCETRVYEKEGIISHYDPKVGKLTMKKLKDEEDSDLPPWFS